MPSESPYIYLGFGVFISSGGILIKGASGCSNAVGQCGIAAVMSLAGS
jgi:hypothetical protein